MRDWGGLVGRNGTAVGKRWDVRGIAWGWAGERVAREGDTFFGVRGANGLGVSEVVRPGCALGRVRWTLAIR